MEKVLVIGCPGSGKSTFARKLSSGTGIPLYYLDMLWHKPDRTNVSAEEFDQRLGEILGKDRWIIDGNYLRTLPVRLERCDTAYFFDLPVEVCLSGAEARIGKDREDLPWVESVMDEAFKQWIIDFPRDQLPRICELLEACRDEKRIVTFKTREEADGYLAGCFGA